MTDISRIERMIDSFKKFDFPLVRKLTICGEDKELFLEAYNRLNKTIHGSYQIELSIEVENDVNTCDAKYKLNVEFDHL